MRKYGVACLGILLAVSVISINADPPKKGQAVSTEKKDTSTVSEEVGKLSLTQLQKKQFLDLQNRLSTSNSIDLSEQLLTQLINFKSTQNQTLNVAALIEKKLAGTDEKTTLARLRVYLALGSINDSLKNIQALSVLPDTFIQGYYPLVSQNFEKNQEWGPVKKAFLRTNLSDDMFKFIMASQFADAVKTQVTANRTAVLNSVSARKSPFVMLELLDQWSFQYPQYASEFKPLLTQLNTTFSNEAYLASCNARQWVTLVPYVGRFSELQTQFMNALYTQKIQGQLQYQSSEISDVAFLLQQLAAFFVNRSQADKANLVLQKYETFVLKEVSTPSQKIAHLFFISAQHKTLNQPDKAAVVLQKITVLLDALPLSPYKVSTKIEIAKQAGLNDKGIVQVMVGSALADIKAAQSTQNTTISSEIISLLLYSLQPLALTQETLAKQWADCQPNLTEKVRALIYFYSTDSNRAPADQKEKSFQSCLTWFTSFEKTLPQDALNEAYTIAIEGGYRFQAELGNKWLVSLRSLLNASKAPNKQQLLASIVDVFVAKRNNAEAKTTLDFITDKAVKEKLLQKVKL